MNSISRRNSGRALNIWPGFVDALSALLMVVIFMLMVFMVAQFYLSNVLSGQDEMLDQLNRQISELDELLDLEQSENNDLRARIAVISADLQQALGERDAARDEAGLLARENASLSDRLAAALSRNESLSAAAAARQEELAEAYRTIEADRETLEMRLRELASLRADIEAARAARSELETQLAALSLALRAAEAEAERLGVDLAEQVSLSALLRQDLEAAQAESQASAQAAEAAESRLRLADEEILALRAMLEERDREVAALEERAAGLDETASALQSSLDETRSELSGLREEARAAAEAADDLRTELRISEEDRERLMAELADLRDRRQALEARLSEAEERTVLAQRELEEQDVRLEELVDRLAAAQADRDEQTELASDAQALVGHLANRVAQLREQLSRVEAALRASEAQVDEQAVEIASLNSRLNQALLRRVEELSRYRSEFFGRLREVLGDREDVRVVGDRFVFQSEVLFNSGSARLQPEGRDQLAQFADTLLDIAAEFPDEVDWILRVDGHTDRRPIRTAAFPSNWELSTARATSVVRFLVDQGVPPDRLAAAGFGAHQPLDPGESEEAYERNRRIELKLDQR
jgi:chemotaxis protein MotB